MTATDEIRKAIIVRASSMEIGKLAVSQRMKTLYYVAFDQPRCAARSGTSVAGPVMALMANFPFDQIPSLRDAPADPFRPFTQSSGEILNKKIEASPLGHNVGAVLRG
jgi:hypothetical protein